MADVFAAFAETAAEGVISHAESARTCPVETMRMVREAIESGTLRGRTPGGPDGVLQAEVLLSFVQHVEAMVDGAFNGSGGPKASFAELHGRVLRDLRDIAATECSPLRQQSQEQLCGKPTDAVLALSQLLARCCEAAWRHRSGADASDLSMNINRVGTLRGAGNAIVPQVAAQFIRAYLEGVTP